ncbi:hypothetical protein [Noviherbaspirillum humi]|nr:hypothetical protein [Noviherbaspirillum humi]
MAVLDYFAGERQEMLIILSGSAVLAIVAAWLWAATRTGFAMALAITVLVSASLLSAMAVSLLVRDKGLSGNVTQALGSEQRASAISAERERISVVISLYKYYRYAAAAVGVLALAGLLLTQRGWVHGLAAGLLLLVVAQTMIDHYSEKRARLYFEKLNVMSGS